jgi:hypothetical protein
MRIRSILAWSRSCFVKAFPTYKVRKLDHSSLKNLFLLKFLSYRGRPNNYLTLVYVFGKIKQVPIDIVRSVYCNVGSGVSMPGVYKPDNTVQYFSSRKGQFWRSWQYSDEVHTCNIKNNFRMVLNPFSHGVFFVYHLTAVGHIRHTCKDYISKNEDNSSVRVCVRPPEQVPPDSFKQSERGSIPRFSL